MFRTRRTGNSDDRIETEDSKQPQELLAAETSGQQLVFDLKDVTLVNNDAVKFRGRREADGIKLANCPLHVRKWIDELKD